MRPLAQHLLKRFELYLAVVAAVFVWGVYLLFAHDADTGITVAATVIGMGLIQSAIQWADRERSARLRQRQIHEIREMLRDQVLNQLATIKVWLAEKPDGESVTRLFEEIDTSIDEIATAIDQLYQAAAQHLEADLCERGRPHPDARGAAERDAHEDVVRPRRVHCPGAAGRSRRHDRPCEGVGGHARTRRADRGALELASERGALELASEARRGEEQRVSRGRVPRRPHVLSGSTAPRPP